MKKILTIILVVISIVGLFFLLTRPPKINNTLNAQMILYYGSECPHCHIVLDYISTNEIDKKIQINSKEVYHNSENQKEMVDLSRICPDIVDTNGNIGVPLAYLPIEKKCILGDQPIIDKIKEMLK